MAFNLFILHLFQFLKNFAQTLFRAFVMSSFRKLYEDHFKELINIPNDPFR